MDHLKLKVKLLKLKAVEDDLELKPLKLKAVEVFPTGSRPS